MKSKKITILGSGASTGIPMVGCSCDVCQSSYLKNKRLRTSILIETSDGKNILIDTTPDLRYQLLREKIVNIDAVIITHEHADHLHGIDDLRPLCFGPPAREIPIYTHHMCAEHMKNRFPYIFDQKQIYTKTTPVLGGGIPKLSIQEIQVGRKYIICDEEFEFLLLPHGHTQTLGIINQNIAYVIDCHELPQEVIDNLKSRNLEVLIIDCVTNKKSHSSHLVMDQAFKYINQINPNRAKLIHMNHDLEHKKLEELTSKLFIFPVSPTFDREVINI